jgi:hypothetical protein
VLICPSANCFSDGEALSGKRTGCFLATLLFLFPEKSHRVFLKCRHPCSPPVDDSLLGRCRANNELNRSRGPVATTVRSVGLSIKLTCHQCAILATRQTYDQAISKRIQLGDFQQCSLIVDESAEYIWRERETDLAPDGISVSEASHPSPA